MKFINLTNRPVTVQATSGIITIPSHGYCGFTVHRGQPMVLERMEVTPELLFPVGVPDAEPGVMLIVPRDVRLHLSHRKDLLTPDGLDESGVYWRFVANA